MKDIRVDALNLLQLGTTQPTDTAALDSNAFHELLSKLVNSEETLQLQETLSQLTNKGEHQNAKLLKLLLSLADSEQIELDENLDLDLNFDLELEPEENLLLQLTAAASLFQNQVEPVPTALNSEQGSEAAEIRSNTQAVTAPSVKIRPETAVLEASRSEPEHRIAFQTSQEKPLLETDELKAAGVQIEFEPMELAADAEVLPQPIPEQDPEPRLAQQNRSQTARESLVEYETDSASQTDYQLDTPIQAVSESAPVELESAPLLTEIETIPEKQPAAALEQHRSAEHSSESEQLTAVSAPTEPAQLVESAPVLSEVQTLAGPEESASAAETQEQLKSPIERRDISAEPQNPAEELELPAISGNLETAEEQMQTSHESSQELLTASAVRAARQPQPAEPMTYEPKAAEPVEISFNPAVNDAVVSDAQSVDNTGAEMIQNAEPIISQIVERLSFRVNNGGHEVQIQLKPDYLGSLNIKLTLESGVVTAEFTAENPMVSELIQAALPQLRLSLQQLGMNLGEVNVGFNFNDNSRQFSDGRQQHSQSRRSRYYSELNLGFEPEADHDSLLQINLRA